MATKQTPLEKELLAIELYQQGQKIAELVSTLGISSSTLDNILTRYGISRRGNTNIFQAHGSKNGQAKLTESEVLLIRQLFNSGLSRKELSKRFDVSLTTIDRIVNRQTWKHVK